MLYGLRPVELVALRQAAAEKGRMTSRGLPPFAMREEASIAHALERRGLVSTAVHTKNGQPDSVTIELTDEGWAVVRDCAGFSDDEKQALLNLAEDPAVAFASCAEHDCGAKWVTDGREAFEQFVRDPSDPRGLADPDFGGGSVTCGKCDKSAKRFLVLDGRAVKADYRL